MYREREREEKRREEWRENFPLTSTQKIKELNFKNMNKFPQCYC